MIDIWVEEEYGYRDFIWHSPFAKVQDFADWWETFDKSKVHTLVFGRYPGTIPAEQTDLDEFSRKRYEENLGGKWEIVDTHKEGFDRVHALVAYMHLHEEFDSKIGYDGDDSGSAYIFNFD
jgi:hypothetical protein